MCVCVYIYIYISVFLKDTSEPNFELYSFSHEPSKICQNVKAHVTHLYNILKYLKYS